MNEIKEKTKEEKLPEGWKRVKLEEVVRSGWIRLFRGKIISKEDMQKYPGDYPVYSSSIRNKGLFGYYGKYMFDEELVSWSVDGGGNFFYRHKHKYSLTNVVGYMRIVNFSKLDYRFLYLILDFEHKRKTFDYQIKAHPSVIKKLYYISIPPLPEQQKIAEILETVDNAIEKTDQIIEKYKRMKQGLMQDLLTKGIDENWRIRSEKTHNFKDSPLGRIPEEWEAKELRDVAKLRNEKIIPPNNRKYIGLENIEKEIGRINGYTPSEKINGIANAFREGDILFGKLRPNLKKYWYATFNGYCSTEILIIIPKNYQISKDFLCLLIQSNRFLKLAESKVFGTKMPRTSWNILKIYRFALPPLPEQRRIASVLSQMDETIEKETQYKQKLEHIKQGLMEDLLTGKVRVNHLIDDRETEVNI